MTNNEREAIFMAIDELVARLEDEGVPFNIIIDEMDSYVEIAHEYLL